MFPEAKTLVQNVKEYFVKPPDPKELVRKWQSDIRREQRQIDKAIRDNDRLEKTAQKQIKEAAKRSDMTTAKLLAKELVHTRKATTRLYTNKAHMMNMSAQLTEQLGIAKVAGTLNKSTVVMKEVNNLMRVPELSATMQQMSKEMMKAGMIDEMMGDAIDDALDSEDMEEETDQEVEKVLAELAGETAEQMTAAPRTRLAQAQHVQPAEEAEVDDSEVDQLQARLDAVRG